MHFSHNKHTASFLQSAKSLLPPWTFCKAKSIVHLAINSLFHSKQARERTISKRTRDWASGPNHSRTAYVIPTRIGERSSFRFDLNYQKRPLVYSRTHARTNAYTHARAHAFFLAPSIAAEWRKRWWSRILKYSINLRLESPAMICQWNKTLQNRHWCCL